MHSPPRRALLAAAVASVALMACGPARRALPHATPEAPAADGVVVARQPCTVLATPQTHRAAVDAYYRDDIE